MFDSHCHLADIPDALEVMTRALGCGVGPVLNCGYNAAANLAVSVLWRSLPALPCAIGLHPWFAAEPIEPVLSLIRALRPTAIGELGLDFWDDPTPEARSRQRDVLEIQLDLAEELDCPVTLHSRKAVGELQVVLRNHPRVRGALHAFGGSREQARQLVAQGFYIGLGGGITWPRSERLRKIAAWLPLDAILLETDAPSIGMEGVAPPNVRPEHLVRVADEVARIRGVSVDVVVEATDGNNARLWRTPVGEPACAMVSEQIRLKLAEKASLSVGWPKT